MKLFSPLLLMTVLLFYSLAYATPLLPGETIIEYRLSADELDNDGKRIINSESDVYISSVFGSITNELDFDFSVSAGIIVEVVDQSGNREFQFKSGYLNDDQEVVVSERLLSEVIELHPLSTNRRFRAMMTAENESGRYLYEITMRPDTVNSQILVFDDGSFNEVELPDGLLVDVDSITEEPIYFEDQLVFQGYDENSDLRHFDFWGRDMEGLLPQRNADSFVKLNDFDVDVGQRYVFFEPEVPGITELDGRKGGYFITALEESSVHEIPIHDPLSTFHSSVFGSFYFYHEEGRRYVVSHVEGRKEEYSVNGGDISYRTKYNLIVDKVVEDGALLLGDRLVIPLQYDGNILSMVPGPLGSDFLLLQKDGDTGKHYLNHVERIDYATTEIKETLYDIPAGTYINNHAEADFDRTFEYEEFSSKLMISAVWTVPNGNNDQPEDIAAVILLSESDVAQTVHSPDPNTDEVGTGSETGGSSSGGALPLTSTLLLAFALVLRRRSNRW